MATLSVSELEMMCHELRRSVFFNSKAARCGHVGGSSSSTELLAALYFGGALRYDPENPAHPNRDRVLIRGHIAPLRYRIFSMLGWINESELTSFARLSSRLEGHEDMNKIPGVDITPSGSLGMLLSYGAGAATVSMRKKQGFHTYVFIGDGEEQEGNVSEAARHAANFGLSSLTAILDQNRKQLSRPTADSDGVCDIEKIWAGYGWDTKVINGHDLKEILWAFKWSRLPGNSPRLIIAQTIKGKGIPGCEGHFSGYHTISTAKPESIDSAITHYEKQVKGADISSLVSRAKSSVFIPSGPTAKIPEPGELSISPSSGNYKNLLEGLVDYLRQLSAQFLNRDEALYVMTADIIRKEMVSALGLDSQGVNFIDVGIREQHLTGLAHGISATDRNAKVLVDVGEEFLYRNADQINAMCQARLPVVILGNMGGICGAANGPTHQPSGQSGMLSLIYGIKVLEPSGTGDLFAALNCGLNNRGGPTYVRMHSGPLPGLAGDTSSLSYYVAGYEESPDVVLVSNGLALKGCLDAKELLSEQGIKARVINVVDRNALDGGFANLLAPGKPVATIYNGNAKSLSYPVALASMGMEPGKRPSLIIPHGFEIGKSGNLPELITHFGFDGEGIAKRIIFGIK